jgi:hypothetical protein
MGVGIISICHTDPYQKRFTLIWSKVKMSKDKNAEKINVENTGETFLALIDRRLHPHFCFRPK